MKYWPSTKLADAPGVHPRAAYELRNVNRTQAISSQAIQAGHAAVTLGMAIPLEMPFAVPPNTEGVGQLVYLREPTTWEFRELEASGIILTEDAYIFIICAKH